MEASPARVIQYFNGEKQNLIPLFQRPYTWKESNWRTLWEDVMVQYDLGDNSTHFMGAIVSVPARSVPVGVNKYLIIDGQQRLTTVSLLLCALRDCLDGNNAARIQEVYLTNRFRDPEDTLKFVPTQADRDTYTAIALERQIPNWHSLMIDAYQFFRRQIQEGVDANGDPVAPANVLNTLEHSLQVVMINLGDADDPYLIFESLNFKGEPLTQADLVRNYLLMRFRHSIAAGGEQERVYAKCWRPLEQILGSSLTEFLRHYAMKDGENIRQGGIYAATKERLRRIDSPEGVEREMEQMQKFGRYYASFLRPQLEENSEVRRRLENIKELSVTTSYPLLLRLFEARDNGAMNNADLEQCLSLIESFVVRRAVCGVPTNALNKLFLQWAKNFPAGDHKNWLLGVMSAGGGGRRFPNAAEFAEAFKNQPQYGRSATRHMLLCFEHAFDHKEPVDLKTTTIEHVLPQTLTDDWRAVLGSDPENTHARLVDTFGNLTLTGYNAELGNLSFTEKKAKLQNTHIELTRAIVGLDHWNQETISNRAEILLKKAEELWPGPSA